MPLTPNVNVPPPNIHPHSLPPPVVRHSPQNSPQTPTPMIHPQFQQLQHWQQELEQREEERLQKWQEIQQKQREDMIDFQRETMERIFKSFEKQ